MPIFLVIFGFPVLSAGKKWAGMNGKEEILYGSIPPMDLEFAIRNLVQKKQKEGTRKKEFIINE